MKKIKFIINGKEFPATLNDSKASQELYYLLPLEEIPFTEKGGYEYYCALQDSLTSEPEQLDHYPAGSVMLYLTNYVALFYNDLTPIQPYTELGKLESVDGLKDALAANPYVTIVRVEE